MGRPYAGLRRTNRYAETGRMNIAPKLFSSLSGSLKGNNIARSLTQLAQDRVPVRLEVENSESSFYTVLSLRPQGVLLGRPADLENGLLKAGGHVRFTIPDGSRQVIRLQIIKPNVRRKRGDAVVLCGIPEEFAEKSQRASDRFNTSRYKNLSLNIPQIDAHFRIVDISRTGCKVMAQQLEKWNEFRVGRPLRFGRVEVGNKQVFELGSLIPRFVNPPVVSFQWEVGDEESASYLERLIKALHSAELGRLKVPESQSLMQKVRAQ